MSESIDDLERAVEGLIGRSEAYCDVKGHCRYCALTAARARELVRRLRAGIAECESAMGQRGQNNAVVNRRIVARDILAKLTGATGEEQSR